jgi:hypothetical protein
LAFYLKKKSSILSFSQYFYHCIAESHISKQTNRFKGIRETIDKRIKQVVKEGIKI